MGDRGCHFVSRDGDERNAREKEATSRGPGTSFQCLYKKVEGPRRVTERRYPLPGGTNIKGGGRGKFRAVGEGESLLFLLKRRTVSSSGGER